jgi:hypothetical protein
MVETVEQRLVQQFACKVGVKPAEADCSPKISR